MSELSRIAGLFVGQLDPQEMLEFESAVENGQAYRSYEGAGGLLGMAKVKLIHLPEDYEPDYKLHSHDFL